jgi:transcription-repair coupling factor (superfamily II helicase)
MDRSVVLSVGDRYKLGLGKDRIVYAGMPSENVYSIVQMKWEFLYRGYSLNLYFPKSQATIRIDGINIMIDSVTADEIRLRV